MSEYLTQSRPYAEAIFQISEQDDAIDSWIQDLTLISNALQDQAVKSLIETPDISQKEKTDKSPKAIGPYSQAVLINNFLFVSGQIPLDPKTMNIIDGLHSKLLDSNKVYIAVSYTHLTLPTKRIV